MFECLVPRCDHIWKSVESLGGGVSLQEGSDGDTLRFTSWLPCGSTVLGVLPSLRWGLPAVHSCIHGEVTSTHWWQTVQSQDKISTPPLSCFSLWPHTVKEISILHKMLSYYFLAFKLFSKKKKGIYAMDGRHSNIHVFLPQRSTNTEKRNTTLTFHLIRI